LRRLLNITSNNLWNQLRRQLTQRTARSLPLNDLRHLLSDRPNLTRPSIGRLLNLVVPPLGEGNSEQTEKVVIGSFDGDVCFNKRLPLADEGAELVGGKV
jgi:hypothetical protein